MMAGFHRIHTRMHCAVISLICLLPFTELYATDTLQIQVRAKQSEFDSSHDYFIGLLKLALNKQTLLSGWTLSVQTDPMTQERALHQLKLNPSYAVYWAGTSRQREKNLQAIRIPLTKGLLGFRVSLAHKDNVEKLNLALSKEQFLKLVPCQAAQWPDTDILLKAGFNVVSSPVYEGLFKQLNTQRCDFFPRGVAEAESEYLARKESYPRVRLYKDTIIHYPFPMYFFVSQDKKRLAEALEQGLEKAIDDGSFDQFMRQHETTRHLFPLNNWLNARYLMLDNPTLPDDTVTTDERYWIQPPENAEMIR